MILTMTGRLAECLLLDYRTPATSVRGLLPPGLELVTLDGWAFWNIVACRIEGMRAEGLPPWCGVTYRHIAYRLYTRAQTTDGQTIDGLYFVRSDADHGPTTFLGAALTDFKFHRSRIRMDAGGAGWSLTVEDRRGGIGNASLRARMDDTSRLAPGSCFATYAEAAKFLQYNPVGLSTDASGRNLRIAEVRRDRSQWHEAPLHVLEARWGLFEALGQIDARLELATCVAPIDYRWRLGRTLPLQRDVESVVGIAG